MNSVQLTQFFDVPGQELWNAWTLPSVVKKWFGSDPGGSVTSAELDVRPGGNYAVTFRDGDGTEHTCLGTYTVVSKFDKLSFTWEWKSEPGHVSHVDVEFLRHDADGVTMKFEHRNLNPQSLHGYEAGWKSTFEKLKACVLENRITTK
ncbi:MAG TPA: SRPBCC domain-containing protein [Cyclobacteriaceae bacterium]|nr:SRPBCC domain-containing protein [Cyclobacteriaceae bacterium]